MELIYSSVVPVRYPDVSNFREAFERQMIPASELKMATGYVSEDSLMELKAIIAHYKDRPERKACDLIIGMHGREGFTRPQYDAAYNLGKYLRDNRLGEVRVCTAFKFHGKVYSFLKNSAPQASILGSSNLSGILGLDAQWEADTLLTETSAVTGLITLHNDLARKATKPILEFDSPRIIDRHDLLDGRTGVEKANVAEQADAVQQASGVTFAIPLKAEAKSNLNVYFGKGRESPSGAIRPRPWYEVEVIVPVSITSLRGYPQAGHPFTVYTDDGWKFRCKVSGQNNKNLRSEDDLQTLGRWIKGRMEAAGVLKVGDLISEDMLRAYGNDKLTLKATRDPSKWLLDFSPNRL